MKKQTISNPSVHTSLDSTATPNSQAVVRENSQDARSDENGAKAKARTEVEMMPPAVTPRAAKQAAVNPVTTISLRSENLIRPTVRPSLRMMDSTTNGDG